MISLYSAAVAPLAVPAVLLSLGLSLGVAAPPVGAAADEGGPATSPAVNARIEWDPETLVLVAEDGVYSRIVRLDSGDLLAGYSHGRGVWSRRSTDNGKTWEEPVHVSDYDKGGATNSELLQLADGRVLYLWNERDPNPDNDARDNGIAIAFSSDGGKTWEGQRRIYGGGPMWEPIAIQDPESGRIDVYFANEKPFPKTHEQEITRLSSTDGGKTWGEPETVSFRKGFRDGMIVPVVLKNGKTVAAIEDNGLNGAFKPVILDITDPEKLPITGDSPLRWSALAEPLEADVYAGAPYLRQMPTGETVLTSQVNAGHGVERMVVWVGNAEARNFTNASQPFTMADRDKHQRWNSLFVKDDQTITAVAGVTIDGQYGMWIIDGRLVKGE